MSTLTVVPVQPDEADVTTAVEALPHVTAYLATHPDRAIHLEVPGEAEALVVPRRAVELLARILTYMAAGDGVSVVPSHAELTTQQAADLLNVSRPFLIGLLDDGKIEYRKVGKHRRVRAASLVGYLAHDDQQRRDAADELSQINEQMGLL